MNLESALALHAAGNLAGAEQGYRAIIAKSAASEVALEKLGLICIGTGRIEEGSQLIISALKIKPDNPDLYLNLAVAHKILGRLEDSIACNRKALELGAKYPEAHLNLGDVLSENGQHKDAISSYKKAIELRPNYAEAHNNMGVVQLAQGKLEEAARLFVRAVQLKPDYAQAHHNLALVQQQQGLFEEAINSCTAALKLLPNPDSYVNLGNSLFNSHYAKEKPGRLDEAASAYRKALQLKPDSSEAYNNLGIALREQGLLDDSVALYRKAITLHDDSAAMHHNLGLVLEKQFQYDEAFVCFERALVLRSAQLPVDTPVVKIGSLLLKMRRLPIIYRAVADIDQARKTFSDSLSEATSTLQAMPRPLNAMEVQSLRCILFITNNFYLSYQGFDDKVLISDFASLSKTILQSELEPFLEPITPTVTNKKIRVGVASESLGNHHGSHWAYNWLANLPQDDYEFFFYSINGIVDEITRKFADLGTFRWLPFMEHNYCRSLQTIKDDKLDVFILTDVGMSASSKILSLTRLAPIQCAGWAHPITTGSQNIDYFLSSNLMEAEDSDDHYSEELVRVSNIGLKLDYPDNADAIGSREQFGIPSGKLLYGSVQSLFKYLPQFDFIYTKIAKQLSDSYFVFLSSENERVSVIFKERLRKCFESAGLNFDERVKILPRLTPREFMQLLTVLDINLDSISWNGGFTTMRSLASNCPVITLPGTFMRGRHSFAMLTMIGMEELIASSLQNYIEIACKLGSDKSARQNVRDKLKVNKEKLFNDYECVQFVDNFIKTKIATMRQK